jgi:hypothetical protein
MKMASSGMLRRVALVITDVSEELSASFIRVTRIGELGTTVALTSNRASVATTTTLSAGCVSYCANTNGISKTGDVFLSNHKLRSRVYILRRVHTSVDGVYVRLILCALIH